MDIKKLLKALLKKSDIITERKTTSTYTLASNTNHTYTFNAAKSGYVPIGIAGHIVEWYEGQTALLNVYSLYIKGTDIVFSARNMYTGNVKFALGVYVIYRKSG